MTSPNVLTEKHTPIDQIRARYDEALASLEARGARIEGTRLAKYRKTLRELARANAQQVKRRGRLPEYVKCVLEISDVIDAAEVNPSYFTDADSRRKLRDISKGVAYLAPGNLHTPDPARDSQFELISAAFLEQRGRFAGFSKVGGDVLLSHGRCVRPVECKRLSSPSSLEARVREICDRLEREYALGLPAGVGFIDVTRASQSAARILSTPSDDRLIELGTSTLNKFILENRAILQKESRIDVAVLGFFLRLVVTGIAGSPHNLRKAAIWQFVNHNRESTGEAEVFMDLVAALDDRPILVERERTPPLHMAIRHFLGERFDAAAYMTRG